MPYSAMVWAMESNPKSVSWTESPPKVNQFCPLVGLLITLSLSKIG